MKIYTIATETFQGESVELSICKLGNGNFPPAFTDKDEAQKYIDDRWSIGLQVVEMELIK